MTTLLILLSLCTLICSDSLSRFEDFVTHDDSDVALGEDVETEQVVHKIHEFGRRTTPPDSLFNGSPRSCADQCLLTKYFCRSFTVVAVYGEIRCIMSYEAAGDNDYFTGMVEVQPRAQVIAEFDIKKKINNVAEISEDPTLMSQPRFDELLHGYGFSESLNKDKWTTMKKFLAACIGAVNDPSSRPSFNKPLEGVESRYEQHWRSGSTSKYTPSSERPQKRRKIDDTPKSNFLADLDLFIRGVNQNVETIYDSIKGTLYIHSPNHQLFIMLLNDYDYVWAASEIRLPSHQNVIFFGTSENVNPKDVLKKTVIDYLVKSAARLNHYVSGKEPTSHDSDITLWAIIGRLAGLDLNLLSENENLVLRDLSKIVPILHDRLRTPFTEQNQHSFPFKDIQVFTLEK